MAGLLRTFSLKQISDDHMQHDLLHVVLSNTDKTDEDIV